MKYNNIVLFDFPVSRGAEAFALEEAILNEKDFENTTVIFTWRTKPTIMIGRYQNALSEVNLKAVEEKKIDLVRRSTGGGTIYTDEGCFQFSIITPKKLPDGSLQKTIDFERFLIPSRAVFQKMGIDCQLSERNDLHYKGVKFNGNAQHSRKDRILYHGSVLYSTDLNAMDKLLTPQKLKLKAKGIKSSIQRVMNLEEIDPLKRGVEKFQKEFENLLCIELATQGNEPDSKFKDSVHRIKDLKKENPALFKRAKKIQIDKFDNPKWNIMKTPKYSIQKEKILEGGFVKCLIDVKNGRISSFNLEGDFFAVEDYLEEKQKIFEGLPYTKDGVKNAVISLCDGKLFNLNYEEMMNLLFD